MDGDAYFSFTYSMKLKSIDFSIFHFDYCFLSAIFSRCIGSNILFLFILGLTMNQFHGMAISNLEIIGSCLNYSVMFLVFSSSQFMHVRKLLYLVNHA